MNYTINGKLYTAICDEHKIKIANTKIRAYQLQSQFNAAPAFIAAQAKELTQVYEEDQINEENRSLKLLGEATTGTNGDYSIELDNYDPNNEDGAVVMMLYYDNVPDYGQKDTKPPKNFSPFEMVMDIIYPRWNQTETACMATWDHTILKKSWCYILQRLDIWVICGILTNCESGAPLKGIEVIAMDDDIVSDDRLGSATTNDKGEFCIFYRSIDFKKTFLSPFINVETTPVFSFDSGPDIYFKFAVGGNEIFAESPSEAQKPSRKNVENCLCVNLCLNDVEDNDGPTVPVAFLSIGNARKYHPVLNIDPATGKTTGKANTALNDQAFYSTIDLRGSLNKKFNGANTEYKFQYFEVPDPGFDVATIADSDWMDVEPNDIARTTIASRLTGSSGIIYFYDTYTIHGTGLTNFIGTDFKVTFDGNWIQVPQYNFPGNDIAFTGSLIKLKTANLAGKTVDKSGLIAGASSAPLEKNRYFALRMLKREAGDDTTIVTVGFSRPLAIFNTTYKDLPQGGTWNPLGKSSELGIATVDLQELVDGGSCSKITNTLTVNYTAANPNLGTVSLSMSGPGGPHNFEPLNVTNPGEEVAGTSKYTGANNTVDPTDVSNLPNCAYEIRLSADLNLTNGESQHDGVWDRVLFCK